MAGDGTSCSARGVVGLAVDPLELGQQAVLAEPLRVVGVVDEHRRPGRGAQHPGRGDAGADEGVDQRRLARAGRAADDREQRRVEGHQARDHVVLELVDHLARGRRAARRPRGARAAAAPPAGRRAGAPARSPSRSRRRGRPLPVGLLGSLSGAWSAVPSSSWVIAWGPPVRGRRCRGGSDRAPRRAPARAGRSRTAPCRAGSGGGGSRARWRRPGTPAWRARRAGRPWRAQRRACRRARRSTSHGMSVAGSSPRSAASCRAWASSGRSDRRR